MSSYLTVKWCDSKPGEMKKPPAGAVPAVRLQMAVDGLECVRAASAKKMPSVLFVFSEAKVKRDLGVRDLTALGLHVTISSNGQPSGEETEE